MEEKGLAPARRPVALITGASSGIGLAAARELVASDFDVAMLCRDRGRGEAALDRIRAGAPDRSVELLVADLAVPAEVRDAAADFRARSGRLDLLVNNAGAIPARRELTAWGIERTFAGNHLGPFLLTELLSDLLGASGPARVVNVASSAHAREPLDWLDLDSARNWSRMRAYGRSKLANVMWSYELSRRLAPRGVTVNAVHPGLVATGIGRGVPWLRWVLRVVGPLLVTADAAGRDIAHLGIAPELSDVTGAYFVRRRQRRSSAASLDVENQERLREESLAWLGRGG